MKKLYLKDELTFALIWIGIYVFSLSLADGLSSELGFEKIITAPLCLFMCLYLFFWIKKMNLEEKFGLAPSKVPAKRLLYYSPLFLIVTTNLWGGIQLNHSILESIFYVISMLCVGFLEELIFRGFLFKALSKDNLQQAILISSITFGIGHIVNLFQGAELFSTLMQIVYAISAGYLFTILFHKTGTLIPCIVTHSVLNSLSAFSAPRSDLLEFTALSVLIIVPVIYSIYIQKHDFL